MIKSQPLWKATKKTPVYSFGEQNGNIQESKKKSSLIRTLKEYSKMQ